MSDHLLGNSCSLVLRYVLFVLVHVLVYLIVILAFSDLGFWSGIFVLIGSFPDHCLPEIIKRLIYSCIQIKMHKFVLHLFVSGKI